MQDLLDVRAAAQRLGVYPPAIYKLANAKDPADRLPVVRIGGRLRFRESDIERFVADRVESSSGPAEATPRSRSRATR